MQDPLCTIAINGQKVPPSSIQLEVMANTCIPGDITELRVSVTGCVYDPCFWIGNTKKIKEER